MEKLRTFIKDHHALYVLFWPIDLILWFVTEKLALSRAVLIHSAVDDLIPFSEFFILFYVMWYPFIAGMLVYCFICEPESFRRASRFFILSFSICLLIYLIFPTSVDLRPATFERNNALTWLTSLIYTLDEPTNVCPSEHVIGAVAVLLTALDTKRFRKAKWSVPIALVAVLISVSIMFTKQHSFWDLIAALPICLIGWIVCFKPFRKRRQDGADR